MKSSITSSITDLKTGLRQTARALRNNRFKVIEVDTGSQAKRVLLRLIPRSASVGIGDSTTVRQIGIIPALEARGNQVINPFQRDIIANFDLMIRTMKSTFGSDVFLTSCNALTLDGKLVSTDMVGNRVAGAIFAAPKTILVVSRNKIVADVMAARDKIREVIAPYHATGKGRKTPCARTDKCSNCHSLERICNVTMILESKPLLTDVTIILVNQDLGLAWDPAWPELRIKRIKERYHAVTMPIPMPEGLN